jgi:hypothetical protein
MNKCGLCVAYAKSTTHKAEFLNWLKSNKNKYVIIETGIDALVGPIKSGIIREQKYSDTYPYVAIYWKKEDESV